MQHFVFVIRYLKNNHSKQMLGYILLAIFIWVMYNLVTRLILPVYFTTKRVKEQFRNMHEQQDPLHNQQQTAPPEPPKEKAGEYIEFEEIK